VSDRPADPTPDDATPDAAAPAEAASEEARRRTDGDRWQASLDSWSTQGGTTVDEPQRTDSGTQEIRLDTPSTTPAEGGASSWSAGSWEQTAQQPSVPEDDRTWEQQSRDQIAAWQQPPSWQQAADAERPADAPAQRPADEPAAPSWRPADQPAGQPAPWDQQVASHQAPPQQSWNPAPPQSSAPPQQQAWEPPPGARPW
jgi:hypothetical protein